MEHTLLDIQNLERHYSRGSGTPVIKAVDGVSLTLERGSILGIVGESGCGKSTLARMIMGFDRPTAGHILFDGLDVHRSSRNQLRRIRRGLQIVFQDPQGSLDPRQTIGTIVAEPLFVDPDAPKGKGRLNLVGETLESVGLRASDATKYPDQFSGGQRQRIAIARAIIGKPKLIVADEPVSALDLSVQAQVLNLIMDLRDRLGISFLFITHSLSVVETIADRVGVMYRGRLIEMGDAEEMLRDPAHPYTSRLLSAEPQIDHPRIQPKAIERGRYGSESGLTSPILSDPACVFARECPLVMERCIGDVPYLERISSARFVSCHLARQV